MHAPPPTTCWHSPMTSFTKQQHPPRRRPGNGPPSQRRPQAHAGPCKPWRQRSAIPLPSGSRSTGRTSRQVEHQQVQYKRADDTPGQPAALRPIQSALQYQHNRSHMDLQRRVILTIITPPLIGGDCQALVQPAEVQDAPDCEWKPGGCSEVTRT